MLLGIRRRVAPLQEGLRLISLCRWMATLPDDCKVRPAKRARLSRVKEPGPGVIDLGQGGSLLFAGQLFSDEQAVSIMAELQKHIPWEQREIRILGKAALQPRLIAYQADDSSLTYTYSRATLAPAPWSEVVLRVKAAVESHTGATFNSCLLNYYRSGSDHISWHSDNEELYGSEPTIASVSFGTPREFLLRRNADKSDKYCFWLGRGSLLVMRGTVQQHWMHSVPKRKSLVGARISLTFRQILHREAPARQGQQLQGDEQRSCKPN